MTMNELDNELEQELDIFETPEEGEGEKVIEKIVEVKDNDDIFEELEEKPQNTPSTLVEDLLKARGVEDSKIKIIDEEDKETEVSFYDLSKEEQLEILNPEQIVEEQKPVETGLGEQEQEFFKYLQENELSVEEYLEKYKEAALIEAQEQSEPSYDIDAYGDEELYLLDLKSKYELTDEELEKELTKELADKELFTKKVSKLREEYKELETAYKKEQEDKYNLDQEEEYGQFVNTMVDTAVKNSEFYGIELEDEEKNDVLEYLLELDDSGVSEFTKSLNSPEKLYEAAWFMKYGKEAFDTIRDAYEAEIKRLKEDNSEEEKPPKVVIKKNNEETKIKSIYDLNI